MDTRSGWELYALGAAFFAGLTALFGKLGVAGLNSNMATLIRTVVIIAVVAAIIWSRNEWVNPASIPRHAWIFLALSGVATGLSWLCYYRALQLGPVSRVAAVDKLSVAFAIVLGLAFAGEALSWPVAIGGLLITAGSIIMIAF
ncbi:transporter family protein [Noviherbaspirillum humi]|uniref:Transporter family protein n=1 Tax=Noviherbaspirillum humi TaxID=1688639 RepID=A0A239LKE1_9BURK|nr:EamA family transporter [Noviherbaspirillum humi]SNT30119.1 transporter family protein [Noviherbaspirillum humi]